MSARFVLIAAAALMSASNAYAADPAKPAEQVSDAQAPAPRLLLASAEQVRAAQPASDQAASMPKPRRMARVTSCRCGGQQTEADGQQ